MDEQINEYLCKYPAETVELFKALRQLIYDSASNEPEETLWAKLPSYCCGEKFVRLIPFKDHINVEAQAAATHREELAGYKFTPKGMVQIYTKQALPDETLKKIFAETLN